MIVDAGRHWQPRAAAERGRCSGDLNRGTTILATTILAMYSNQANCSTEPNDIEGTHMKSHPRLKSLAKLLFPACIALSLCCAIAQRSALGQAAAFFDLRFTAGDTLP